MDYDSQFKKILKKIIKFRIEFVEKSKELNAELDKISWQHSGLTQHETQILLATTPEQKQAVWNELKYYLVDDDIEVQKDYVKEGYVSTKQPKPRIIDTWPTVDSAGQLTEYIKK